MRKKYAAFLRGINVGGNRIVPMLELKKAFEKHGCGNVSTLLASGNVIFEGEEKILEGIPAMLERRFGFSIDTIVLPMKAMEEIARGEHFRGIKVTPKTRLYVTFLKEKPTKKIKLPYVSDDGAFKILEITDTAVFSVLDLEKTGTVKAMEMLEKEFGRRITTRNYNTVQKIAEVEK